MKICVIRNFHFSSFSANSELVYKKTENARNISGYFRQKTLLPSDFEGKKSCSGKNSFQQKRGLFQTPFSMKYKEN